MAHVEKSCGSHICVGFFLGRGALQDVCREWPTSRFAAVYTLNPENPTPTPKDTARTLNKQCAACYSRISGSMSAHLAQVKNRSCQRVARIRIYMGKFTQGWPVPPRGKKNPQHRWYSYSMRLRQSLTRPIYRLKQLDWFIIPSFRPYVFPYVR